ncbi:MAG: hypothetical protein IKX22_08090 [Prevotella sp.]|nr:hypothetical protein [Prevotella sp.]
MKRIIMIAVVTIMATMTIQAQNIPTGMRMEIAESEGDKTEFSIFSYKDEDGTFGYYLGLGRVLHILPLFRDDITDASFDDIKETCIWLGATTDEAFATIDTILDLYDKDVDTSMEFQGRMATGSERLGEPSTSTCIVKKKTLGGKRLQFLFTSGERQAEVYLNKSVVKELRWDFKADIKLHPKQYGKK